MATRRDRFRGHIVGVGSTSGVRVVLGRWHTTPLGAFSDVMVETDTGHRLLLVPSQDVADYVTATYSFDEVRIEPVVCTERDDRWSVTSPSLTLEVTVGRRMPLGWLLRAVPRPLGASPIWARLVSPVARVVLPGVRTVGTALEGRREFYGATDLRHVTAMRATLDGRDLGELADIDPPCRFGFSSTPRTPSVTSVVTTVVVG
ncbi:hypothetical protein [Knoellia aerolata]|uniref:Uncharacterized protein n=1 Tax=Knoellia aerolata DSM 18566 TaxID=1385519 RepID=A0A0A0JRJ7_9MICO|nr:hypothetical protein [Knoellia aerolata]KGN39818.1 hypothetical protein N801_18820 [Knoellia aerolata DSM 18566]